MVPSGIRVSFFFYRETSFLSFLSILTYKYGNKLSFSLLSINFQIFNHFRVDFIHSFSTLDYSNYIDSSHIICKNIKLLIQFIRKTFIYLSESITLIHSTSQTAAKPLNFPQNIITATNLQQRMPFHFSLISIWF